MQCLSCDGPYSLPPLPLPEADQGARSTSSTFSCPTSPTGTGTQLPSYPLRAGLALAALGWPSTDCPLWSLLYAVYIHFFKKKTSGFICSLLWHSLRPVLCKAGVPDLLCKQVFQDRCWMSVHLVPLIFFGGWRVLCPAVHRGPADHLLP